MTVLLCIHPLSHVLSVHIVIYFDSIMILFDIIIIIDYYYCFIVMIITTTTIIILSISAPLSHLIQLPHPSHDLPRD